MIATMNTTHKEPCIKFSKLFGHPKIFYRHFKKNFSKKSKISVILLTLTFGENFKLSKYLLLTIGYNPSIQTLEYLHYIHLLPNIKFQDEKQVLIVIKNNLTNLYTVRVFQPRDIILSRLTQLIRNECNNPQLYKIEKFVKFTEDQIHHTFYIGEPLTNNGQYLFHLASDVEWLIKTKI
ncbi:hypothetical protein AGLY_006304 [Aphis glycines]|uniref:Uncharacterized protein n=1 Tax=Aphis glycines TaxID=307491 RepID=A0A6G0TT03_APHGL|nr:hypothetical protein AGLY_006304 [Aphis glycines]